jgi:hypothetical protein
MMEIVLWLLWSVCGRGGGGKKEERRATMARES